MTANIQRHLAELTSVHKGLVDIVEHDYKTVVSGSLPFEASTDGMETISELFDIELTISHDFPETLPRVREIGGRIGTDYNHIYQDGTLCLAVPVEARRILLQNPTLLSFVNRLVIPYLYGFSFWQKYGKHPFDEALHGNEGILAHYIDTLGLADDLAALAVICFLYEHGYRGHHDCPCRSGLKVRACHGPALLALHQQHSQQTLQNDFIAIFEVCYAKLLNKQLSFPVPLARQVLRLVKKVKKELAAQRRVMGFDHPISREIVQ